jgi:hypothetical protein
MMKLSIPVRKFIILRRLRSGCLEEPALAKAGMGGVDSVESVTGSTIGVHLR